MTLNAMPLEKQNDCLDIILNTTGSLIVKILTVHGKFIKTICESLQPESNVLSVSLADLSTGNYVVNVFKDNSFVRSIHINKN